MNKLFLSILIAIFLISFNSAYSNNTFNNSLSSENLTFTGSQNITRYLNIPQNVYLTNAFMNLSGKNGTNISFFTSNITNFRLNVSLPNLWNTGQNAFDINESNIFVLLHDLNSPANLTMHKFNYSGTYLGYVNISQNNYTGDEINFFYNNDSFYLHSIWTDDIREYYTNGTYKRTIGIITNSTYGSGTVLITGNDNYVYLLREEGDHIGKFYYNGTMINAIDLQDITTDIDILNESLYVQAASTSLMEFDSNLNYIRNISGLNTGETNKFFRIDNNYVHIVSGFADANKLNYSRNYVKYNPLGINITIGNTIFSFNNSFEQNNNRTSNFANYINTYLGTCSYSGGYCQVPIQFHSDTAGILKYSDLVFNNVGMLENSITYNNFTYETASENFTLNFTISDATNNLYTSANLFYNNTAYASTITCSDVNCLAKNTINIPLVNSRQNYTFYWTVTTFDGITYYQTNSSFNNQTVDTLNLTYCTSGVRAMNFTLYDEQNRTRLYNFTFDGTFEYSAGGTNTKVLTISNQSTSEVNLCINVNTTYYLDSIIAYSKSGYTTRNWFYQNYPINNITKNVSMYSLLSSASTSFIINIQDKKIQGIPNVLINAQRCYPGYNTNETVFIHRTDSNGLTTGNFEAETALYKYFITNNSETIFEIDECSKVVPQDTPYTLLFQLGGDYVSPFNDITNDSDVTSTIFYNKTSQYLIWTYIDTSSNFNYANLTILRLNASGNTLSTYCTQTSNLSSGILSCNVSTPGTYSARAYIIRNSQSLREQYIFTVESFSRTVGYYGAFLGFFLTLIACFVFKWSEVAGIWAVVLISFFNNFVGLIAWGIPGLTAMTCIAIVITAILER